MRKKRLIKANAHLSEALSMQCIMTLICTGYIQKNMTAAGFWGEFYEKVFSASCFLYLYTIKMSVLAEHLNSPFSFIVIFFILKYNKEN